MGKEKGDKEELEMKKMLTAVCFFVHICFGLSGADIKRCEVL